jgi:Lsr2
MAKRTIIEITDDLDGSTKDVKTVQFGFEGISYEIDLGPQNFDKLAQAIAPFVAVAHKLGGRRRRGSGSGVTGMTSDNATIRAWAVAQGIDVPTRGRISAAVREQFDTANRS